MTQTLLKTMLSLILWVIFIPLHIVAKLFKIVAIGLMITYATINFFIDSIRKEVLIN